MFYEAQEAILQRLDGVSIAQVVADGAASPVPIEGAPTAGQG
jgi:hypothetical protein